jgi:hypothetical protein
MPPATAEVLVGGSWACQRKLGLWQLVPEAIDLAAGKVVAVKDVVKDD